MSQQARVRGTVLVVEDEPAIRRLVAQMLAAEGYQVTVASGLEEALRLLREQRFGLVVTDLFPQPGQARLASIAELVRAAAPASVGVITAWAVEAEAEAGAEQDVVFLLRKPFDLEELLAAVAHGLTRQGQEGLQ